MPIPAGGGTTPPPPRDDDDAALSLAVFPDATLPITVEAAFGATLAAHPRTWAFTDLSARVLADTINITRGASSGASDAGASSASLLLRNEDGALTPTHPESAYWPNVVRNTPMRVVIAPGTGDLVDAFNRVTSGWGTSTSGSTYATAAFGTTTSSVSDNAGRHTVTGTPGYVTHQAPLGTADVDVTVTCQISVAATGGDLEPTIVLRRQPTDESYLARVVIAPGTQAVSVQVRYKSPTGPETILATGLTSLVHSTGTPLRIRARVVGGRIEAKVWQGSTQPAGWTVAAAHTVVTAAGRVGLRSGRAAGGTGTAPTFVWTDFRAATLHTRATGYADDWQPTYQPDGVGTSWSQVRVNISGIRRRLDRGDSPAWSPIRRAAAQYVTSGLLLGYWPLEDAGDAKTATNVVDEARPMAVTGTGTGSVGFASYEPAPPTAFTHRWGTSSIASLADGGRLIGPVKAGTSSPTAWAVRCLSVQHAPSFGANIKLLRLDMAGGTHRTMELWASLAGGLHLYGTDDDGVTTLLLSEPDTPVGLGEIQFNAVQAGANIDLRIFVGAVRTTLASSTVTGATLGRVVKVTANPNSAIVSGATVELARTFAMGHIQVWDTHQVPIGADSTVDPSTGSTVTVWEGWAGESTEGRIARLCAAEGVPVTITVPDDPNLHTRLGAQGDASLLQLVGDAALADGGMLHEADFALAYLTRSARYNQTPQLVVDLASYKYQGGESGDVLNPVYDDQGLRNDQEYSRPGGSKARYEDTAHILGSGRYADSGEINVQSDGQLRPHAAWSVHLGTVDEMRYPTMTVDLLANPELISDWLACDVGSRVQRVNAPHPHPPGVIDQVIDGYTEALGLKHWTVTANCSPSSPWQVGVLDDGPLGKLDTDGTHLITGLSATAGTFAATVTAGPGWTTNPAEFDPAQLGPLDIAVGGEVMRVITISGALPTYSFTVTRSHNGISKSHPANAAVRVHNALTIAL